MFFGSLIELVQNSDIVILSTPIVVYSKADTLKLSELKDNKGKTDIYKWTQIASGKSYAGSAIDLSKRFRNYYNISYLERESKKNNSIIYKALIKYGYNSFELKILEYYDPVVLLSLLFL